MPRTMTDGRVIVDYTAPTGTNALGWVGVDPNFIPRDDLAICHFFGTDYPGPSETYDYSMSYGQAGAGTAVGTSIFEATKLVAGSSAYVVSPWTVADFAGSNGFGMFAVGEFVGTDAALISTFAASELAGFSLYRSVADSSYRIQTYQSGTDYNASLATTAYSADDAPETFYANVTDTGLTIWHKQPGEDWRKATASNSILVANLGTRAIRFGRSHGSSQNQACNVLGAGLYAEPFASDTAVYAHFALLQAFILEHAGVTI